MASLLHNHVLIRRFPTPLFRGAPVPGLSSCSYVCLLLSTETYDFICTIFDLYLVCAPYMIFFPGLLINKPSGLTNIRHGVLDIDVFVYE